MSTTTDPNPPIPVGTPGGWGPAPAETAPSRVVAETPAFARFVGFAGLFLLVLGLVAVVTNEAVGPRWIGKGTGYLFATFGLALMLYHAVRDGEQEVRRLYGMLGGAFLIAALAAAVVPGPVFEAAAKKEVGFNLLPWGVGFALLGLLFAIPFVRHETDERYRQIALWVLLGVGAALAVGSLIAGVAKPDFLAGPGIALALLGLGFLCAYLGSVDESEGLGYRVAFAIGILGAAAIVYAVAQAVAPTLLYDGPNALRKPNGSLDLWKVAARVVAALAFLGVAAAGALGRFPGWLKITLGVLGLAGVALFVTASVAAPLTTPPKPTLVPGGVILMGLGLVYLAVSLGICSDNQFITLARRELAAYFLSPIGYLVLGGMAAAQWIGYWEFVNQLERFSRGGQGAVPEPIVQFYIIALFPILALTLEVPALTMRLLSEEKRTGSLEVLLTAPVVEWAVVLSKFLATWLFFLITWLPAGLFLIALRMEVGNPFDYRPLLSFYLALAATGAGFVAMGLFFSALTKNQIVAAVVTFLGMFGFLVCYFVKARSMGLGQTAQAALAKLSYIDLWSESLSGQLPLRDVLLWVSMAVFWLFLTIKILETRKWS